jgi:hypothetical protein
MGASNGWQKPKSSDMVGAYKSATVTQSFLKKLEWNAVNPTSEKLKFGRGTPIREMNL